MREDAAPTHSIDADGVRDLPLTGLRQRPPFRFLSSARRSATDAHAVEGAWIIDGSEWFFAGHFPGEPIVPGVLITESMAQLCGVVPVGAPGTGHATSGAPLLVKAEIRFRAIVRPPAVLLLHARFDREIGTLCEFEVSASLGNQRIAEGRLTIRRPMATEAG
jgi:3-hydroxyacyl-[acyl-carrier-protein] dehydratase